MILLHISQQRTKVQQSHIKEDAQPKQCLENIQFTINKNNDIEFHIIDVKPLEREPEVVSSIIKLHRMSDNE